MHFDLKFEEQSEVSIHAQVRDNDKARAEQNKFGIYIIKLVVAYYYSWMAVDLSLNILLDFILMNNLCIHRLSDFQGNLLVES